MSQTLVALVGSLGGMLVAVVDGSRAVRIAALASALALAPAAASVAGGPGALVLAVAGLSASLLAMAAQRAALRLPFVPGLDPVVPVVAPRQRLFGPRSLRVIGAAASLLAASWVGLNVDVGVAASASGSIFATAYIWLVGVVRLLRARSLEDLAIGTAAIGLASATGWLLEAGAPAIPEASAVAGLAPLPAVVAGWMVGRHRRRDAAGEAVR